MINKKDFKKGMIVMSSLNETLEALKKGIVHPVYLLHGTERYFMEQFKDTLIKALKNDISDDITTYDLKEMAVEDVIIDVETLPFFNERKVIFAYDPIFLKAKPDNLSFSHDIKRVEAYLDNPISYSILVFIAPYEKIDERKKITKSFKKNATVVNCNPIRANQLRKWILYMAKQRKIELSEEALFLMESEFENNLYMLQQEMEKLALFVGPHGQVTKEVIVNVISTSLSHSALELVDAVLKRDLHLAIKIYKDLEKKKEDPIGLIALLAYQFRIIFQVKLLRQKGFANQHIQKEIKVHPYVIKLASERSSSFTKEKLTEIMNELTNTDATIKQGKMEKGMAFELLLYTLIKT